VRLVVVAEEDLAVPARSFPIRSLIQSRSEIQSGIDLRNEPNPRGAYSRYVSKRRSNLTSGLS